MIRTASFVIDPNKPVFDASTDHEQRDYDFIFVTASSPTLVVTDIYAPKAKLIVINNHQHPEALLLNNVTCRGIEIKNNWDEAVMEVCTAHTIDLQEIPQRLVTTDVKGPNLLEPAKVIFTSFADEKEKMALARELREQDGRNHLEVSFKFPVCPV